MLFKPGQWLQRVGFAQLKVVSSNTHPLVRSLREKLFYWGKKLKLIKTVLQ